LGDTLISTNTQLVTNYLKIKVKAWAPEIY
jgi:hypothetical protein